MLNITDDNIPADGSTKRLKQDRHVIPLDNSDDERARSQDSLFGMKAWAIKNKSQKRFLPPPPPEPENDFASTFEGTNEIYSVGNVIWVFVFGWWLALIFAIAAFICLITYFARKYAFFSLAMAKYIFFPFGKFIVEDTEESFARAEAQSLIPPVRTKIDAAYIFWMILFTILVGPGLIAGMITTWFFVVSAPMAKVNWQLFQICFSKPLHVVVLSNYSQVGTTSTLLLVYRAFSRKYLSYSLLGVNIFFVNCMPIVLLRAITLLVQLFTDMVLLPPLVSFFYDIVCVVPITFYIGMSIECITLQTSYMVGAILNATFGSLTELLLFTLALNKGNLSDLIIYSLTGGLLNDMLLIPGLSMIAGGIKYKEQKFNPSASGVGSLLFFMAITGAFSPTIFYSAFGGTIEQCKNCSWVDHNGTAIWECQLCYRHQDPDADPMFYLGVQKLMYISAVLFPIAYVIGLIYTFRTHSHLFQEEEGETDEHAPWNVGTASFVMVVSMLIFGIIAEDVVALVEVVLHHLGIQQSFLGVTLIALTPAFTEIVNAIRFALDNQMGLSVQIGAASAVQVALVQMPCLVLLSFIFARPGDEFHLVFPTLSVFSVTLAVFTFNYISVDGRANYFIGFCLVVIYILMISAFYFIPVVGDHPF